MNYWVLNKQDGTPAICRNAIALSNYTGIDKDRMYYNFSRKKLNKYEDDSYLIYKLEPIKS